MTMKTTHIWVWIQHRDKDMEQEIPGLINEAKKISTGDKNKIVVSAVLFGSDINPVIAGISHIGVDNLICVNDSRLQHYQGELFAQLLFNMTKETRPSIVFMVQNDQTQDLGPRLAALMESACVTQAQDFNVSSSNSATAVRSLSDGYLFETVAVDMDTPPVICFNPAVLTDPDPNFNPSKTTKVEMVDPEFPPDNDLKTRTKEVIEADGSDLDLDDADIIIAGGRGAGNENDFKKINELAGLLGGPVGGTRPVIDNDILPYERQIGQTGKIVSPKLLINIGISGANEYTAGIEKSKTVVAVNTDEQARIFNFADLGLVGDASQILDAVIERIRQASSQGRL